MDKGIEFNICYAEDADEISHRAVYATEQIGIVNEVPVNHPSVPGHVRVLCEHDKIAVILIKMMEAYTQCFTIESYEEVKEKLRRAGIEII